MPEALIGTHEKSSKLYDSDNFYLFDNLQKNCSNNLNGMKKIGRKEYQWHLLNEKGYSWISQLD